MLFWYSLYRCLLVLLYVTQGTLGILLTFFPEVLPGASTWSGPASFFSLAGSAVLLMVGTGLLLVALSFFMPRSPTGYAFHILVMGLGCSEGVLGMAMAIPLLLFWVRPEVQAWFGWPTELDHATFAVGPRNRSPHGAQTSG